MHFKFQQTSTSAGDHGQTHINYDGVPITPSANPLPDGRCDAIAFVATTRGVQCNLAPFTGLINNSDGTQATVTVTSSAFGGFYGNNQSSGPVWIIPLSVDYVTAATAINGTLYALYISKK